MDEPVAGAPTAVPPAPVAPDVAPPTASGTVVIAAPAAPPPPHRTRALRRRRRFVAQAWDDRTFDDLAAGTVFERCVFQQCTFRKPVRDVVFRECTFTNTRFRAALADTTFVDTTVHEGRFERRQTDCTWTQCALTRVRGPWYLLRCKMHACTVVGLAPDRRASWTQCLVDRGTRFIECTLERIAWVDSVLDHVTWERCCLDRGTWTRTTARHVAFKGCGNHHAVYAGNRWHMCAWSRCAAAHTRHLSDHHVQSRVVACRRTHAQFHHTSWFRDVHDDTSYDHSEWTRCAFTGSVWRRVTLHEATLDHVTFAHATHLDVDKTNTTFRNITRRAKATTTVTLHRHGPADPEPTSWTVALFGDRVSVHPAQTVTMSAGTTHATVRVPVAAAALVDFVHVCPVAPWYTLGLSVPTNAHHVIGHVVVDGVAGGSLYADKIPYRLEGGTATRVGYRRRQRRRAHSR